MAFILALLSLILLVAIYAGFVKLAARLYRRTNLSWKFAFGFGGLATLIALVGTVLKGTLPVAAVLVAGLGLIVASGGWFLASRATDPVGLPVGFKVAAVLSAIAVGVATALGIALALVLPAIAPR